MQFIGKCLHESKALLYVENTNWLYRLHGMICAFLDVRSLHFLLLFHCMRCLMKNYS